MYTLYYAPGAASLLVHWLLIELDQPYELRAVDLKSKEHKQDAYLALNPGGVVPTLIDAGVPRSEAAGLAMMLGDRHRKAGLAPGPDDPGRPDYYQWMFHLANVVQPLFRLWWYPAEAAGEAHADAALEAVRPRIEAAWTRIDQHLGARGPWLLGAADGPSIADFYLTMLMRWSRGMPRPATDWSHLADLARRMKARPSFGQLYEREGLTDWT